MEFEELTSELDGLRAALVKTSNPKNVVMIARRLYGELDRIAKETDLSFGDTVEGALDFLIAHSLYIEKERISKVYPDCIPNLLIWYAIFRLQEKLDEIPDVPEDEDGKEAPNDPE